MFSLIDQPLQLLECLCLYLQFSSSEYISRLRTLRSPSKMIVLLEGYLKSRNPGFLSLWKERYFLLQTCGDLIYFKSHRKLEHIAGRFNTKNLTSAEIVHHRQGDSLMKLRYARQNDQNGHLLLASNKADAITWLMNIENLRRKLHDQEAKSKKPYILPSTQRT
ncbi:hypothetical protein MPTK1_Vg00620 [Marchantia polymorpha subsp. ruderalis]|uniref:PH domain-containing protein n=1 Tax=Marchantia polymorpha TaxID=3197 RepID=A0A2R6VX78_MARPO|nr:hypothetical protein MARPO_YA0054 [Marchantia polymorpha]BBN20557.1 hypothetical protein Mp_Vg00620 [Marchantia polymorpha subsp. ruderalis]|eukprot:PTQ26204.1 hypothetical protein MARPO_YA0054 [Marchantia polymorpha]